jgi:hypothetical protein
VSDDPRRVETQAALDRLHLARRRGGLCASCGVALAPEDPVYREVVAVDIDRSALGLGHYTAVFEASVGAECASPEFLGEARERPPERCDGCGRGVYYQVPRRGRRRAACCRNCRNRASAKRARRG